MARHNSSFSHTAILVALTQLLQGCFATNPAASDQTSAAESETTAQAASTGPISPPLETESATATTSDFGSGSSTSANTCQEAVCEVLVPFAWTGPYQRRTEKGEERDLLLFSEVSAPSANCNCNCGSVESARCQDMRLERYDDDECDVFAFETLHPVPPINEPACLSHSPHGGIVARSVPLDCDMTPCPSCPATGSIEKPDVQLEDAVFLHRARPAACEGRESCFERRGDLPVCIAREGIHECPLGFDSRQVLFGSVDDHRGCSSCECSPPTSVECELSIFVYDAAGCSETNLSEAAQVTFDPYGSSTCLDIPIGGSYRVESELVNPGLCTPLGGQPTGTAEGSAPHTLCCV